MSTNALPTTPLLQEDRSTAPLSGWRKTIADTLLVGSSTLACQALGVVTSLAMRALLDPAAMGIWQGLKTFLSYANYTNLGISKGATQELAVARGRGDLAPARRGLCLAHTVNTLTSLLYAAGFVLSILVRRPLVGVIWGMLNGQGSSWRRHRVAVRAYDIATAAWALVFAARYLVQHELYDADRTGWLAVARIGMGWPLTAVALLVTLWAVRRADRVVEPAPETVDEPIETEPGRTADGPEQDVR